MGTGGHSNRVFVISPSRSTSSFRYVYAYMYIYGFPPSVDFFFFWNVVGSPDFPFFFVLQIDMTRRLASPRKSQVVFKTEFWQRAPYFGEGDSFWKRALGQIDVVGDCGDLPSGPPLDLPPAGTITRFGIERDEIAYSDLQFAARLGASWCGAWATWTDAILEEFSPVLRSARLYDAIVLFRDMDISCVEEDLMKLFSLWCSETHTFIAA